MTKTRFIVEIDMKGDESNAISTEYIKRRLNECLEIFAMETYGYSWTVKEESEEKLQVNETRTVLFEGRTWHVHHVGKTWFVKDEPGNIVRVCDSPEEAEDWIRNAKGALFW